LLGAALLALEPVPTGLAESRAALAMVNRRLWTIEDQVREKDAQGEFGPEFVALARSVYRENDERGRIKRAINTLLGSGLVEEKLYSAYWPSDREAVRFGHVGPDPTFVSPDAK
jgi:hypothetical protein